MNWILIDDEPVRVTAPSGIIYSTRPLTTRARDGFDYYLKGPEAAVVAAEAFGYALAERVGLRTPPCALCRHPGTDAVYFASRAVRLRSGLDYLTQPGVAENPELIGECFAFDVWTANRDRNAGNIVADPLPIGAAQLARLFVIDFESAQVLRGVDRFSITAMPLKSFQPSDAVLRARCFAAPFPASMCTMISGVTRAELDAILSAVTDDLAPASVPWRDATCSYLEWRGGRIMELAKEVWNA